MAPYWLLLAFSGVFGFLLCEFGRFGAHAPTVVRSRQRDLILVLVLTVIMVMMAVLRADTVGVDTREYLPYFGAINDKPLSFFFTSHNSYKNEVGFSMYSYLLARMTDDPIVWLYTLSVIIIVLRMVFIYLYSPSVWVSVFVYIGFGFFGYAMCTLRQELAISIMMFAIPLLQKKKIAPYMLICIVAAMFHMSLWVMIPVYFLAHLPLNKLALGIYCGGTLLILLFSEKFLEFVTQFVFKAYKPGTYYTLGRDYSTAVIPVVTFVLTFLLMKKLLTRNPQNIVLINFSLYAALLFVLTLKHFIFQRVALIFLPAVLLLIPEMIRCIEPSAETREKLAALQSQDKVKQKQQREKLGALKVEFKNEIALYYTSMGLILAGCALYFLFLLSANRLLLVPYLLR